MAIILHVITTLEGGGAESALRRLVIANPGNAHHVVSLRHGVSLELQAAGVPVHSLGMPSGRVTADGLRRLARLIRQLKPDVVQTWMYHADLVGGVVARLVSASRVSWGIRNAYLETDATSAKTRAVAKVCAWLSHVVPTTIVSCSAVAAQLHAERGYARDKMRIIPNGYDGVLLARDEPARAAVRDEWGVDADTFLFGMVARQDPQKDHANLIAALGHLKKTMTKSWRCAFVGAGMTEKNQSLMRLIDAADVRDRVVLAEHRSDVSGVMSALDLHVLSSRGEAFPNVVAEAMSCGTPGLVTDVGDAALIVGDTGWVVPPREPQLLADAIRAAATELADPARRHARQDAARSRISNEFNMERMISGYEAVWTEVAGERATPHPVLEGAHDRVTS